MKWPENMPWYDRKDPYPRKRCGAYTVNADGTITMSRQDYLDALMAREEATTYEERVAAWWERMRKRGAVTVEDSLPEWRARNGR